MTKLYQLIHTAIYTHHILTPPFHPHTHAHTHAHTHTHTHTHVHSS